VPELHSLENETEFPLVVWAFARRDAAQTPLDRLLAYGKVARRKLDWPRR
jgi:hypothetical protein